MKNIYDLSTNIYGFLIRIASLFHPKAKLWVRGRQDIFRTLPDGTKNKIIWIHCASLGEYEQGRTLVAAIQQKTDFKILLTFYSPSGYEAVKNNQSIDWVRYLPLDTKKNAEKFVQIVQPQKALFIKYEFWPNYLLALKKHCIPTFNVSGIFREDQHFFQSHGKWFKEALKSITHFYVQDEDSKQVLQKNGINNVTVSGDTRYDRVIENASKIEEFKLIQKFKGNSKTIVCGSTWPKDVELILQMKAQFPDWKFIIAPHNLNQVSGIKTGICFSKATSENIEQHQLLIIDSIGILSQIYQYADVSYIGGGFGSGIHNILEALAHGSPVVFGPKFQKFKEAKEAVAEGIAKRISNSDELKEACQYYIDNKKVNIQQFCYLRKGATDIIFNDLV